MMMMMMTNIYICIMYAARMVSMCIFIIIIENRIVGSVAGLENSSSQHNYHTNFIVYFMLCIHESL